MFNWIIYLFNTLIYNINQYYYIIQWKCWIREKEKIIRIQKRKLEKRRRTVHQTFWSNSIKYWTTMNSKMWSNGVIMGNISLSKIWLIFPKRFSLVSSNTTISHPLFVTWTCMIFIKRETTQMNTSFSTKILSVVNSKFNLFKKP